MNKLRHTCAFGVLLALNLFASPLPARTLSPEEVRSLATTNAEPDDLPVVVNARVVEELNSILASSESRTFFRGGLAQMENYKKAIAVELREYDVPRAMLVVPLIESGYRNRPQKSEGGAGLWMFIARTAHDYGLVVDDKHDERLDIERETNAGVRLLSALRLRFQSWELALAAYNQGGAVVQDGIDSMHTRDAWKLVSGGKLNGYLPRFEAALIIMRNPTLVD